MKGKMKLAGYVLLGIVLTYTVMMVGCGRNPFTSVLGGGGNVKVSVGKL